MFLGISFSSFTMGTLNHGFHAFLSMQYYTYMYVHVFYIYKLQCKQKVSELKKRVESTK